MTYIEAVEEILEKASRIKLPGEKRDIVTLARIEFGKKGSFNSELSDSIEQTVKICIRQWTTEQKRGIWESSLKGLCFYDQTDEEIDEVLEVELLYHIIDSFCPEEEKE